MARAKADIEKQLANHDQELYEEIAIRAHEIFEARGGVHGADVDDWLEAEKEVMGRQKSESRP